MSTSDESSTRRRPFGRTNPDTAPRMDEKPTSPLVPILFVITPVLALVVYAIVSS
ncbi:MAG: hypothetical protein U0414_19155 [Polyangiaceae bacterium]